MSISSQQARKDRRKKQQRERAALKAQEKAEAAILNKEQDKLSKCNKYGNRNLTEYNSFMLAYGGSIRDIALK